MSYRLTETTISIAAKDVSGMGWMAKSDGKVQITQQTASYLKKERKKLTFTPKLLCARDHADHSTDIFIKEGKATTKTFVRVLLS